MIPRFGGCGVAIVDIDNRNFHAGSYHIPILWVLQHHLTRSWDATVIGRLHSHQVHVGSIAIVACR